MSERTYTVEEIRRIAAGLRKLGYSEPEIVDIFMLWRLRGR